MPVYVLNYCAGDVGVYNTPGDREACRAQPHPPRNRNARFGDAGGRSPRSWRVPPKSSDGGTADWLFATVTDRG